ncbi:MAG: hypothetical protein ACI9UA_004873 [Pseudoalteromonas tetraodonis]|jgi:hypothetical protein
MDRRKFFQLTTAGSVIGAARTAAGHTHQDAYIEANPAFPYGQVVGGGSKAHQARLIDGKPLVLNVTDLDGKMTRTHSFSPLG